MTRAARGGARALPAGRWRLERRHAEGGAFTTLDDAPDEALARDLVRGARREGYGDLLRLVDPAGGARRVWVVGRAGPIAAGPVPRPAPWNGPGLGRKDWVFAWEAPERSAAAMVKAVGGVDRRRLILAGCDCGAAVLDLLPAGDDLPGRAIDATRAWALGRGDAEEVRRLAAKCLGRSVADLPSGGSVAGSVAHVAWMVAAAVRPIEAGLALPEPARTAYAPTAAWGVLHAVNTLRSRRVRSADTSEEIEARSDLQQAPFVRRHVPLSVALLARAGEPTPTELGF